MTKKLSEIPKTAGTNGENLAIAWIESEADDDLPCISTENDMPATKNDKLNDIGNGLEINPR